MALEVLHGNGHEAQRMIEKYLTEDDKHFISKNRSGSKVLSFNDNNHFLLYSTAKKVKDFVEYGHFVAFIAYGIDFMLDGKAGHFSLNRFADHSELVEVVHECCWEWYQEDGELENDFLDKIYAWLAITPYAAMSMTDKTRQALHGSVEFLWMSTVTNEKSFANECYIAGKRETNRAIQHWIDNVPIMHRGCGYMNIIKPQEC